MIFDYHRFDYTLSLPHHHTTTTMSFVMYIYLYIGYKANKTNKQTNKMATTPQNDPADSFFVRHETPTCSSECRGCYQRLRARRQASRRRQFLKKLIRPLRQTVRDYCLNKTVAQKLLALRFEAKTRRILRTYISHVKHGRSSQSIDILLTLPVREAELLFGNDQGLYDICKWCNFWQLASECERQYYVLRPDINPQTCLSMDEYLDAMNYC